MQLSLLKTCKNLSVCFPTLSFSLGKLWVGFLKLIIGDDAFQVSVTMVGSIRLSIKKQSLDLEIIYSIAVAAVYHFLLYQTHIYILSLLKTRLHTQIVWWIFSYILFLCNVMNFFNKYFVLSQGKKDEAIRYLEMFMDIAKNIQQSQGLVDAYTFLGNIYNESVSINLITYHILLHQSATALIYICNVKTFYHYTSAI